MDKMNAEMTALRDQIAIAAMQAIITKAPFRAVALGSTDSKSRGIARGAYDYADEMLAARDPEEVTNG